MSESVQVDPQRSVLVVIDMQNDFCAGGALAVPDGDAVVPVINQLATRFHNAVLTQDWHPHDHSSFASQHPGSASFSSVSMPYGEQTLWPDHCVQHSAGAQFHADLRVASAQLVIRKGFRRDIDSYSAFFENDRNTPTGLAGYLRERQLSRLTLVGLATDFCVAYSAIDAARLGFEVTVILQACRAINLNGSLEQAIGQMRQAGVRLI
jgi:nicotinamidase/pyrazinamidase